MLNQRINDPLVLLIDGRKTSFRGLLLLLGGKWGSRAGVSPSAVWGGWRTRGGYSS
jgi:hypothetical protein